MEDRMRDPDSVLGIIDRAHVRDAISDGASRFPLLKRGGEAAISDVLRRYEEIAARTERIDIPIARLLKEAEDERRDALRTAHETIVNDPRNQTEAARKTRALGAISSTLERLKAQERGGNAPAFERAAVRRETQAELRARTRAQIEKAWRNAK